MLIQFRWETLSVELRRAILHILRCIHETFSRFVGPITDFFNVKSTRDGRRRGRESISRFNRMRGERIFERNDELGSFLSSYTFDICNLAAGTIAGNKVLIDDYNLWASRRSASRVGKKAKDGPNSSLEFHVPIIHSQSSLTRSRPLTARMLFM